MVFRLLLKASLLLCIWLCRLLFFVIRLGLVRFLLVRVPLAVFVLRLFGVFVVAVEVSIDVLEFEVEASKFLHSLLLPSVCTAIHQSH